MGAVRLLDLGLLPSLRSQSIYHAVAHATADDTPDTLILTSPMDPYVCIGFHQDAEREVDLDFCQGRGLPVYRRMVGGGAVYLDSRQIFTQWVFRHGVLPASLDARFELHIRPLVETHRAFGIDAYHRPLNDIHVKGRKIGGTGAATIGQGDVVVGSLMLDFDTDVMSRVLRVDSEKMRDKLYRSLREYVTSMARELGRAPDQGEVKAVYLRKCRDILRREIVPGQLLPREELELRRWDRLLASRSWLHRTGGMSRARVKVREGVWLSEGRHKAPGGLIHAVVCVRDGRIDDLALSGDFTMLPASGIALLERAGRGLDLDRKAILGRFEQVYHAARLESPLVTPEDFADAVMGALEADRPGTADASRVNDPGTTRSSDSRVADGHPSERR